MINWRHRAKYTSDLNPSSVLFFTAVNGIGFVYMFEKFPPIKPAPFHLITLTRQLKASEKMISFRGSGLLRRKAVSRFFILIVGMGIVIQLMSFNGELHSVIYCTEEIAWDLRDRLS